MAHFLCKEGIENLLLQHRRIGQEPDLLGRQLHGAEGLADLCGVKRHQPEIVGPDRREPGFLPPGAFVGEVVKSLVLLDCAANRRSRLHARVRRIGDGAEGIDRLEIAIPQIAEERTVQVVRSGTRDDIYHPAGSAPVLGCISVGDDLKLLYAFL